MRAEGKTGNLTTTTTTKSNTQRREEEEEMEKKVCEKGKERERMNEEKAYYRKTDGPPIHSGPTGTWRDNSLHLRVTSAAERGGVLKHDSVCALLFVNL